MVRLRADDGFVSRYLAVFQFQNGAIESNSLFAVNPRTTLFQFQNGAIERQRDVISRAVEQKFQFQNGAIERPRRTQSHRQKTGFNSKMVRLRGKVQAEELRGQLFQFQNGAIESCFLALWRNFLFKFQFQNGAIERAIRAVKDNSVVMVSIPKWCDWESSFINLNTHSLTVSIPKWCDWELRALVQIFQNHGFNSKMVRLRAKTGLTVRTSFFCFNSKMVRLRAKRGNCYPFSFGFQFQNGAIERFAQSSIRHIFNVFQFQNGAIESRFCRGNMTTPKSFNSKMVRLREKLEAQGHRLTGVSIPKWCDWEVSRKTCNYSCCSFQFQNGAIERNRILRTKIIYLRFQFQNGAIESEYEKVHNEGLKSFQFQNGAIERKRTEKIGAAGNRFQFQNGAIESTIWDISATPQW